MLITLKNIHTKLLYFSSMEWDTAEGGKVFQKDSEEELVYNKEDLLNPEFLCFL